LVSSSPLPTLSNSPTLTVVSPLSRAVLQPSPIAAPVQPQTGDRPMGRSMSASLIQLSKNASPAPGSDIKEDADQVEHSRVEMANCVCSFALLLQNSKSRVGNNPVMRALSFFP
jgi:hypothetical protein